MAQRPEARFYVLHVVIYLVILTVSQSDGLMDTGQCTGIFLSHTLGQQLMHVDH